jgi:tetratricopeptide (TPR) repeat protein
MATRLIAASAVACMLLAAACATHGPARGPVPQDHPSKANGKLAQFIGKEQEADKAYTAGDMARAAQLYAELLKTTPDEAEYWYRLGNAHFRLQQPDEAVADYGRALQINPAHARAWHNLGVVRMRQAQAAMIASAANAKGDDPLHDSSKVMADRITDIFNAGAIHADGVAPTPQGPGIHDEPAPAAVTPMAQGPR